VIDKKKMTEEDVKLQFITPAITGKWSLDHITMETKITDGKINLKGNFVFREKPKKATMSFILTSIIPSPLSKPKTTITRCPMVCNRL
jgi:type I restriction enzyme R subunit